MIHHKRIGCGEREYYAVDTQGIIAMIKTEHKDATQAYKRIDYIHDSHKLETLMGSKQTLVGSVDDTKTSRNDAYVVDKYSICQFARLHIEPVVDIPQTYCLGKSEDDDGKANVQQQVDVERSVHVAILLAHLSIEEARRGTCQ